ncbi:DUF1080 domain-containing protein [Paracoccus sp. S-4012]|uniref:family 16 glycoside hydrolase n=1 Tax=Paracoccus sp. S-4012 TaxID=2665648 RepID=UPI0012B016FE|nr:family 16 glycoside hydrolase [Paracoccus sp. S-4012]MRX51171.1 DUF1080 domain-containing protein [Paracoccus sp. S-4012]
MLPPLGDAIDALNSEIAGVLSAPVPPLPAPEVVVHAVRAGLPGVGGFVGLSAEPQAEIHARVLDAEVTIRVMAASRAGLLAAEARAARDIIAADPVLMRRRGVLRIARISDPDAPVLEAGDGIAAPFGRDLRFAVRYEHRPQPVTGEGVIAAVPQDVALAGIGEDTRLLYATEFLTDPLADFDAVSGPGTGTEGAWAWDAAARELVQTGTRRGGADGPGGDKTGTWLVLRPSVAGGPLTDFVLRAEMRSDGPGGIGFVHGFRDPQNFGFALLEEPDGHRLLGRREGGAGSLLAADTAAGFPTGEWLRLRLLATGGTCELTLNERVVLTGRDDADAPPGAVGLFCRGAGQARFRHFRLTGL